MFFKRFNITSLIWASLQNVLMAQFLSWLEYLTKVMTLVAKLFYFSDS